MAKSSWSCLLTKGNRKDPHQSLGVCSCTNQFPLCECEQMVLNSNHWIPLVPWDWTAAPRILDNHSKKSSFQGRKELLALKTEQETPGGGARVGGPSIGRLIWNLWKVHANTGILCMFLERVHSFYPVVSGMDYTEKGKNHQLYTRSSEISVSPWSASLGQD